MIAAWLARTLAARRIHYGWLMLSLVFLTACSSAAMSVPGVLLTPISNDLGWSIGELSARWDCGRCSAWSPVRRGLMLLYGPQAVLACSAGLLHRLGACHDDDGEMATLARSRHHHGIARPDGPGDGCDDCHTRVTARRGLALHSERGHAAGQLIFLTPAAWIAQTYGWRWPCCLSCS
jgi:hypothetical protein